MEITGKQLKKLSNKDFLNDIKKYIKNTHEFYKDKIPEIEVLAKRLHDEYDLNDFYNVFNKFWNSGLNGDRILAIHTLMIYNEEFDINTWNFLKSKLIEIRSIDEADSIGEIISWIYVKYSSIKNEILKLSSSNNVWIRRISVICCYYLTKRKELKENNFVFKIISQNINDKDEEIQKALGFIIRDIGRVNKEEIKRIILKHKNIPEKLFIEATEKMKYLRKLRNIKKLNASL